ncbi:MAG: HpyAIV family type II restriction enzyme [Armatimonadota bacterium]
MNLDYETFATIMNRHIFQSERRDLLQTLIAYPQRFVGLFRPTRPESKLFQHIFQAREIKFGDAMEEIIGLMLEGAGFIPQGKHIATGLECDHYFLFPDREHALLIEQKVRDDHDSTKRQGQWKNFEEKVQVLFSRHKDKLTAVLYFIDPSLHKNRNFYTSKIAGLKESLGLDRIYLLYGEELFVKLGIAQSWEQLVTWLKEWKNAIPVMPDVNWETQEAIDELKELAKNEPQLWLKFALCSPLWQEGIVDVLFPTRKGLLEIVKALQEQQDKKAQEAAKSLLKRLGDL